MEQKEFNNLLSNLIKHYADTCPIEAKRIREEVKNRQTVEMYENYSILHKQENQTIQTDKNIEFLYFLNYCLQHNDGEPLIEILNHVTDFDNDTKSDNAMNSQKTLINFLNKRGISLEKLNWSNQKKMSKEYSGEQKPMTSTKLLEQIINDLTEKNKEIYLSDPKQVQKKEIITIFTNKLKSKGFFELEMVKRLTNEGKTQLIKLLCNNKMPYGIAMLDFLGFIKILRTDSLYKGNIFLNKLFHPDSSDKKGTNAGKTINSLQKPNKQFNANKYKEDVKKDYYILK